MNRSQNRYFIEWGKNLAILLLALSAVYLMSQSTLYDGFGFLARNREKLLQASQAGSAITVGQQLSVQPVRLAVNNQSGRYGVQYDQQSVNQLFEMKLGSLLREALKGVSDVVPSTEEQWKSVLSGKTTWAYYDFLTDIPLSDLGVWLGSEKENPILTGEARRFLLTSAQGNYLLYYCTEENQQYYRCVLSEVSENQFKAVVDEFSPNGSIFAFEEPELYGSLKYDVMILPTIPHMPVYEANNPLANLQEGEQEKILQSLLFNPRAVSFYQTADGMVIREGLDALRILNDGTITFQSQETEQVRYPIQGDDLASLLETTQKLFMDIVAQRCGEGVPYLIGINSKKDGTIEVLYGYRLNGAPVQLDSQGYAAYFLIQDDSIRKYSIRVRQYTSTEDAAIILPEKQAAAAVKALGQEGKELLLAYFDLGETPLVSANWVTH